MAAADPLRTFVRTLAAHLPTDMLRAAAHAALDAVLDDILAEPRPAKARRPPPLPPVDEATIAMAQRELRRAGLG